MDKSHELKPGISTSQDESHHHNHARPATTPNSITRLPFSVGKYVDIEATWPKEGRHILASFNDESIVVYQAYNARIAKHATEHQTFSGCPLFNESRMTWIKTNFLWMMYRSNWGRKDENQAHILAITITRHGFEEILLNSSEREKYTDVRLQWDPDHTPYGEKVEMRRAIQLGLRNNALQNFLHEWTVRIDDITEFVQEQRQFVYAKRLDLLRVPVERVYPIANHDLAKHVQLD